MVELDRSNEKHHFKERVGFRPADWEQFTGLCMDLAANISDYDPDLVLGNGRGGLIAALLISHMLQKDMYPIRLSRREDGTIIHDHPVWSVTPTNVVEGKKIIIVDEYCDTGETLRLMKAKCKEMGASETKTAVLFSHRKGQDVPDYIGVISDELILNIWDRMAVVEKKFVLHPEYVAAVRAQGVEPDGSFLHKIKPVKIAKSS